MKDNVFLISDASFKLDHTAILAVKDMYTGRTVQKLVKIKIKNSLIAEELALRYAIEIAKNKEYKHVIFIYDCLAINVDKFKKRYSSYFESMQFLWLKRNHISDIDKVTKFPQDERLIRMSDIPEEKRDDIIIDILSKYVSTEKEKNVFSKMKKRDYKITKNNRSCLFSLTYYLLSKNGKKSIKRAFKEHLEPLDLKKAFAHKHSKEYYGLLKQLDIKEEFIKDMLHIRSQEQKRK
jgi:hypothetical protein